MFGEMLKLTMVLFVLMAFFVFPPSILSDGDGWGSPVYNKTCKGTHDHDIVGECPKTSEPSKCTGSVEYKMNSESEGCVTESYGSNCYTKTKWELIGTAPCVFKSTQEGDAYCTRDISNLTQQSFTDCKVISDMN